MRDGVGVRVSVGGEGVKVAVKVRVGTGVLVMVGVCGSAYWYVVGVSVMVGTWSGWADRVLVRVGVYGRRAWC